MLEDGATGLEPTYSGGGEDVLTTPSSWNYVSFAYKEWKHSNGTAMLKLLLARANNDVNPVQQSGLGDHEKPDYHDFNPEIIVGGSKTVGDSFDGVIKHIQVFDTYHGFSQLQAEKI